LSSRRYSFLPSQAGYPGWKGGERREKVIRLDLKEIEGYFEDGMRKKGRQVTGSRLSGKSHAEAHGAKKTVLINIGLP
jgi:hypothetical protein